MPILHRPFFAICRLSRGREFPAKFPPAVDLVAGSVSAWSFLSAATGNVVTANASLPDLNDIATTYFCVRQVGNTFA
jgi:hypothetical protein